VLNYCTTKSKGKGSKASTSGTGKGKGPARDVRANETDQTVPSAPPPTSPAPSGTPAHAAEANSSSTPPSTATSSTPRPWHSQQPTHRGHAAEASAASTAMEDEDGPERGSKRPADSSPPEATQNQDEEDEIQEAAWYRRGDGHLV
jgi:hypothetical protein